MINLRIDFNTVARHVLAGSAIVALSPVFAAIAATVYMDVGDGVYYTQERYGQNGEKFKVYKFRTMVNRPPEKEGAQHDAEFLTKTGYWLRRSGLDELPQLFNIFKGEMNLVGPRPVKYKMPEEFREVYNYKPGIFSPKNATAYRRITIAQPDFEQRKRTGAKIELERMKDINFWRSLKIIYDVIACNIKNNYCGNNYPDYTVHPKKRLQNLNMNRPSVYS